jgi:hypothetical protein
LGDGPPGFRRGFTCPAVLRIHSGGNEVSATGLLPSLTHLSRCFTYSVSLSLQWNVLQPLKASLQVWALSVSLAATQEIDFSFSSSGYLDVSVPRVCLLVSYVFRYGYHSIKNGGFPHSDILGSKLTYSSPRRFAVRRVLLRLLVPRHSPCALSNLTNLISDHLTMSFIKYGVYKDSLTSIEMIALCVFCIARFSFQRTICPQKKWVKNERSSFKTEQKPKRIHIRRTCVID